MENDDVRNGTGCCPPFDPKSWDGQEFTWEEKPFLRRKVRSLFYIPLTMGAAFKTGLAELEKAGALPGNPLSLSEEKSMWGSDLLIEATKDVPGADMVRLSGRYVTKVFEGPYRDIGKWIDEMNRRVAASGRAVLQLYFYYTTCPKCAKKYGKNYVVLIAQV